MEIYFRTKEESNHIQREDFLKLSPEERFYSFLNLMYQFRNFPTKNTKKESNNFLIVIENGTNSLGK